MEFDWFWTIDQIKKPCDIRCASRPPHYLEHAVCDAQAAHSRYVASAFATHWRQSRCVVTAFATHGRQSRCDSNACVTQERCVATAVAQQERCVATTLGTQTLKAIHRWLTKIGCLMILRNAKNVLKPIWNQGFWCFGTSQIIKIIKKALHQCKKTLCHKPRFSTVLKASKLMILMNAKNVIKPVWNQGFWCFGTSQIIKIIKKALHQCKKVPPDKSRFLTVLKASKLMILWDAKNIIKPVWNQGFWCFGTSQIIKNIKKALHQHKKTLCHKPRCYMISKLNNHKM